MTIKKCFILLVITIASGLTAFTQDDNKQFVNDSTHEVSFGQIKQVRIAWVQSQELEKENSFLYKEIDNYSLQVDNYQSIIIQKDSIKSLLDREIQLLQLANNASNDKIIFFILCFFSKDIKFQYDFTLY